MNPYIGAPRMKQRPMQMRAMQLMASRIANIALPSAGYNVFSKLRERQFKRYGNFGMANDPRTMRMPPDQYISGNLPNLPTTASMETIHERSQFNTRQESMQREMGMTSLNMPLHQDLGAPRQGIASAQVGPQPAGMAAGNPMVEDQGWGVTLGQIIGSGLLSQQQLQSASFANILSMVRVDGGTEQDRQEMAYYLQRYVLEGMIRGVDLIRDIKEDYGGSIRIQLTDGAVCGDYSTGIIGCGGMGYTQFRKSFWNNAGDGTKLALFYHEVGHEMLNRGHNFTPSSLMGYDRFNNSWQSNGSTYTSLMDELFRNAVNVSRFTPTRQTPPQWAPEWFPSVPGGTLPPGTPPGSPPGPPPIGPPQSPPGTTITNTTTNTYNLTPVAVQPGSSSVGNIMSSGAGIKPAQADDTSKTPVAGTLPDMAAVQSFAAGLASNVVKSSGIANLSNALLRFKSG